VVADDDPVKAPQGLIAPQDGEQSVLNLLEDIILSVRAVDLHDLLPLVHGSLVPRRPELFKGHGEHPHCAGLRLHAQVIIAGIVPSSRVEPWHLVVRLEFRQG